MFKYWVESIMKVIYKQVSLRSGKCNLYLFARTATPFFEWACPLFAQAASVGTKLGTMVHLRHPGFTMISLAAALDSGDSISPEFLREGNLGGRLAFSWAEESIELGRSRFQDFFQQGLLNFCSSLNRMAFKAEISSCSLVSVRRGRLGKAKLQQPPDPSHLDVLPRELIEWSDESRLQSASSLPPPICRWLLQTGDGM
jgi:hypothetical protein